MSDWLEKFWIVLCHSGRTQLAIAVGLFFFVVILLMGQILVGSLELQGPLATLTDVVRDKLMHRYDKAAWSALASFALVHLVTVFPLSWISLQTPRALDSVRSRLAPLRTARVLARLSF